MNRKHFNILERLARIGIVHAPNEALPHIKGLRNNLQKTAPNEKTKAERKLVFEQYQTIDGILSHFEMYRGVNPNVGPTPETKAKKKKDSLGLLHKAKTLGTEHMMAADDINRAYMILTGPVQQRGFKYEQSTGGRPGSSDLANLTNGQIDTIHAFYDWCEAMDDRWKEQAKKESAVMWIHGVVVELVTGTKGLREVEKDRNLRSGTLTPTLVEGLGLYAEMRSWLNPSDWTTKWLRSKVEKRKLAREEAKNGKGSTV